MQKTMISSPWYTDPQEQIAFNLFALSTERKNAIEKVIDYLANCDNPNNQQEQELGCVQANLSIDELTNFEIQYIEERVAREWTLRYTQ